MKCPHCLESFHEQMKIVDIGETTDSEWSLSWQACPACGKAIIKLLSRLKRSLVRPAVFTPEPFGKYNIVERLIEPKAISRSPLPKEVPEPFANDYKEACLILADSPKASAALSRRCLQNIIHEKAKIKERDLNKEIDKLLESKQLPSHLAESVDAIRNIGNFAAHPIKSKNTGEIVDVEPGEAEWTLDVLEGLFDHYFVQPAILAKKRDALNKKLQDVGKPPMK
jgi:hypothetical protein